MVRKTKPRTGGDEAGGDVIVYTSPDGQVQAPSPSPLIDLGTLSGIAYHGEQSESRAR
jgi:hypothetical protein